MQTIKQEQAVAGVQTWYFHRAVAEDGAVVAEAGAVVAKVVAVVAPVDSSTFLRMPRMKELLRCTCRHQEPQTA